MYKYIKDLAEEVFRMLEDGVGGSSLPDHYDSPQTLAGWVWGQLWKNLAVIALNKEPNDLPPGGNWAIATQLISHYKELYEEMRDLDYPGLFQVDEAHLEEQILLREKLRELELRMLEFEIRRFGREKGLDQIDQIRDKSGSEPE